MVVCEGAALGLFLNEQKAKVICTDSFVADSILSLIPAAWVIDPACAYVLGCPVVDVSSVAVAITNKIPLLHTMGETPLIMPCCSFRTLYIPK